MTAALNKLRAELAATLQEKKDSARKVSDLRRQIADRERRESDGLAYAIGRAALSDPANQEAAQFLRTILLRLPPDRAQQLREILAEKDRDPEI